MSRAPTFSLRCLLSAVSLWLACAGSAHAALIIPFSFADSQGGGTVFGQISGLSAGETSQQATSVEILESPFLDSIGTYDPFLPSNGKNSFDVDAGGMITLADFVGDFFFDLASPGFRLDLAGPASSVGLNRVDLDELGGGTRGLGSSPAVPDIFGSPVASVPAPTPLALFVIGASALIVVRRRTDPSG